ncbi:hypothetical protein AB0J52_21720, partial [Spirillospora sp. NPDC049652]
DVSAAGPVVQRERLRFLDGMRGMLGGPGPGSLPDVVRDAIIGGIYGTVYNRVAAGRTQELPGLAPALAEFALSYFAISDAVSM